MGWRREKRPGQGERATVERLEPRILYSADLSPLASTVIGPQAAEQRVIDTNMEFAAQSQHAEQHSPHEVVFVDARTPDYALLVQDIAAQSGRQLDVVMLDAARDGLEQIGETLAGRDDVAALHIIGHGGAGVVQLGSNVFNADALERRALEIEAWQSALTADADILLYGCDIAASAQGQLFVDALARLTDADVSASDDATGHAALGGDWKLEYATGAIEVPVAPSESAQAAWSHLLDTVLVSNEPPFTDLGDQAYEIKGGQPWGQTFSHDSGAGTYVVNKIELVLYKSLTAGGGPDVVVQLRDAFSGGTIFANGSVARADLGTTEAWVSLTLSVPVILNDNQTYFIRINGTGSGEVYVGVHDAGTYADGDLINKDDVAETPKDMAFRLIEVPNTAPVADLNAGGAGQDVTAAFTEQTPVLIAPVGTLADVDSANLASLTATLTARPDGDAVESLALNAAATAAAGGLTVSYTAGTGVLSVTGSATVATYQTILQGIQYNNTSDTPTTSARAVTVVVNDGALPSATATSTLTVAAVNDAPVADLNAAGAGLDVTVAFTEQTPALIAPLGTLADADTANLASLTMMLTARPDGDAVESLSLNAAATTAAAGLTVSYTAATGALSITGSASLATYQTILQGIQYNNASDAPTTSARSVTVVANDGALPSATATSTITVTALNEVPVNTVPGAQAVDEDAVLMIAGLSVNDVDGNLATTQLSVAGGTLKVSLAGGASISAGGNGTGTLTLSGTQAQVNAALAALSYQGNLNFNGADMLTVLSTDSAGVPLSDMDTVALAVAAVNDAPVASAGATLAYTQKGVSAVIDNTITLSDVDDTQFSGATVTIAAPVAGDTLTFVDQNGITGGFAGGVLTLTGSATLANYEAALRSVTYSSSATDPTVNNTRPTRTITWTVTDASSAAVSATSTVDLGSLAPPIVVGIDPGPVVVPPPAASAPPPAAPPAPVPGGTGTPPAAAAGGPRVAVETAGSGGGLTSDAGALLVDIGQLSQALQSAGAPTGAPSSGLKATGAANFGPAVGAASVGLDLGPLANAQSQASPVFVLEEFLKGGSRSIELVEALDRLRDEIDDKTRLEHSVNGAAAAAGMSLTVGYLLWLARGGILLSSLMASLPAWRLLDPLPVLGRMSDDEDEVAEDDSAMSSADTAADAADRPRETRSA